MRKKLYYFIVLIAIWFLCHVGYMIWDGFQQPTAKADIAVILGTTVHEDGTLSPRLEQRMLCGLALYQRGLVDKILVSGGLGKEGHQEAEKMKEFLLQHQVPESSIFVDNYGNNTWATVNNTMDLQSRIGFKRVVVVSQYFHITRTKMMFNKLGFYHVQSASPAYFEGRDFYGCFREFVAFYWTFFTR
ncbi:ElyC/SanA/YdcF family protein [Flavobacterium sp. HSC-61S13]|uniref:YdcF family protein n=1 Tax=Flavobacterium sp. HSC-61S13 TaxID=2910963 RepID=UPI00209DDF3D|nr:vancomycin permeability regulator SanA [Flavobacterium sp. HSC-61S13]